MDKKIDLIAKLFITYIFILALCFLVYSLVVLPTSGAEKVNAIIGLLGWSATIFAPIAAYLLLDNWKNQIQHEKSLDCLTNAASIVGTMHTQIIKFKLLNLDEKLRNKFDLLNQEDYLKFINQIAENFNSEMDIFKNLYYELNKVFIQYEIISNKKHTEFEYILNNYFKIYWQYPDLVKDYLFIFHKVKSTSNKINDLEAESLYSARKIQVNFIIEDANKNQITFLSTHSLKELREKSIEIIKKIRKKL